jgi:hypothetical protein
MDTAQSEAITEMDGRRLDGATPGGGSYPQYYEDTEEEEMYYPDELQVTVPNETTKRVASEPLEAPTDKVRVLEEKITHLQTLMDDQVKSSVSKRSVPRHILDSMMEAMASGQTSNECQEFAKEWMAQEDTEEGTQDTSRTELNELELDNFKVSVQGWIVELRALMTKTWGPIEKKRSKPTQGLRVLVKESPEEEIDLKSDNSGLPMTDDFKNHLTALWELKEPGKARLQQLLRVVSGDFDKFCHVSATPSTADAQAVGIEKEHYEKTLRPQARKDPFIELASSTLHTASDSIRLGSIICSSMQAHNQFLRDASRETKQVRDDIRKVRSLLNAQLTGLFKTEVNPEKLFKVFSELSELADRISKSIKRNKTEQESLRTTEDLSVATAIALADMSGRQVASATRSLREVWANKLLAVPGAKTPTSFKQPFTEQPIRADRLFPQGLVKGLSGMVRKQKIGRAHV